MEFEEFVTTRAAALVRTATALSGDLGLAEDLVQDVLIKVHRKWRHVESLAARDSYVHRMLVNEFLSWRRKWARIVPVADLRVTDEHPDHAPAHGDRQVLDGRIRRLPMRQQAVLALRYYAALDDAEIADLLGCRVGTVRSLASRALSTLRSDPTLRTEFRAQLVPVEKGHAT